MRYKSDWKDAVRSQSELRVGWEQTSITPDQPVNLFGMHHSRISTHVEEPCTATVLALESIHGEQAIWISCDLIKIPLEVTREVRRAVADRIPGFDENKLLISCTHTHNGPDFSCMISPAMFRDVFIPSLRRQTSMAEHTIFHLDGPNAIRHLDALLELPNLDGIQWVPGPTSKSMSEWLPLLRRIQEAGCLLIIRCSPDEAENLLRELRPIGLLVQTTCHTPTAADDLVRRHTSRRF